MKKILYILLVLALNINAATRYWVPGGTGNVNSTTNWSTTSGGTSGASFPTVTEDVVFDSNSGSGTCTINVSANWLSLTSTGSANTISISVGILTVSGNITLGSGMTITAANQFQVNATSTITSNGVVIPKFIFGGTSVTITLADNLNVGDCGFNGAFTVNTHTVNVTGNLAGGASLPVGTTTFVMTGTGTVSGLRMANPFVINTSGTITFSGSNAWNNTGSVFNYITAGSIVTTGASFSFVTCTITSGSSCVFPSVFFNGVNTLLSDMYVTGGITGGASGGTANGAFTIYVSGSIDGTNALNGTATYIQNGTGNLLGRIDNSLIINTSGTITLGTTLSRSGGTWQYIAGTVITTGNTFTLVSSTCTLDLNGVTLNNMSGTNNVVASLSSNLIVTGTLTANQAVTFSGVGNATIGTFITTTAGQTYIFQAGNTYTITNALTVTGTAAQHILFKSSSTSVRAILTLNNAVIQTLKYCDGTWIDSSLGKRVRSYKGVLSNTINWYNKITDFNTYN